MLMRIYYDDTDAGGIVYHANYLKFCERARSELFFDKGKSPTQDGGHFIVRHIDADFLKSAKLGDIITVKHKMISMKNTSLKLLQNIWLDEVKIFEMTSLLVFAKDGKPCRMSQDMKEFLVSMLK